MLAKLSFLQVSSLGSMFPKREPANERVLHNLRAIAMEGSGFPLPVAVGAFGPRAARIQNPKHALLGDPLPVAVARCPLPVAEQQWPVARCRCAVAVAARGGQHKVQQISFAPSAWLQTA